MNDDSLLWHLWLCNISLWIAIQNGGDMWQEPSSEFTLISLASFSASSPLITTSNVCIITRVLLYIYTHIIMMTTAIFIVVIFISNADHSTSFLLKKVCVCVCVSQSVPKTQSLQVLVIVKWRRVCTISQHYSAFITLSSPRCQRKPSLPSQM